MMNVIGSDCENIIWKNKHHMEFSECLSELEELNLSFKEILGKYNFYYWWMDFMWRKNNISIGAKNMMSKYKFTNKVIINNTTGLSNGTHELVLSIMTPYGEVPIQTLMRFNNDIF